jgi:tryptophan-rich sensory protein
MAAKLILFLILNFAGLWLGSIFTSPAVSSEWYLSLNKAPWTPPGWVFGFMWTSIMICFAIYMAYAYDIVLNKKKLLLLYAFQWILNFIWNPIFFHYHHFAGGLFVIISLTLVIGYFAFNYRSSLRIKSLLIAPYLIWLMIASSLNLYALLYN